MIKHETLPTILGRRLILRPMTEDDAYLVVGWRNCPEIMRWMFTQESITLSSHLQWFRMRGTDRVDYMICLREDQIAIGTVSLADIDAAMNKAEGGKLVGDTRQRGKGYATEAFGMWLHFCFHYLGLDCVYVRTLASNTANIRVNARLGFEVCSMERNVQIRQRKGLEIVTMQITKSQALEKRVLPEGISYQ